MEDIKKTKWSKKEDDTPAAVKVAMNEFNTLIEAINEIQRLRDNFELRRICWDCTAEWTIQSCYDTCLRIEEANKE